ncbi:MAG: hypothetical protein ACK6DS_19655 [Planctomycetota bacterium]
MKVVRSLLAAATVVAVLSASFSWAQCCGGASYSAVGAAAGGSAAGDANGSYTVMRTQRRIVWEKQEVTRTRNVWSTVSEE